MIIERLDISAADALAALFKAFDNEDCKKYFHPHKFDIETAVSLCESHGLDYYCVGMEIGTAIAYGFLRGLDAGYSVPSIGIAIHPAKRGQGLARMMMYHLHLIALQKDLRSVRLKVYPENISAVRLYEKLGYQFEDGLESGQLVGHLNLDVALIKYIG